MIESDQLLQHVIRPVLGYLDKHSVAAERLLLMVAAHESRLGTYIKQVRGPAEGIYQMEPATEKDIWDNYLAYRDGLANDIDALLPLASVGSDLIHNLAYQTAMARAHFMRVPDPLPHEDDLKGLAMYCKRHWNTMEGAATWEQYLKAYRDYCM